LIGYTARALAQIDGLAAHYQRLGRTEAIANLRAALAAAEKRIEAAPFGGLSAPRPYPVVKLKRRLWIKEGRYWIAYNPAPDPTIVAIFYESANIPGRL
jgi:plasmid stabilization system protein ParE